MILHQWDIVRIRVRADDQEEHPAVVLSREEWCQDIRQPAINVLYCTTKRPAGGATAGSNFRSSTIDVFPGQL